jgi:peptidoglycan hydrolase-like protein with peptidoglycan-binding domain
VVAAGLVALLVFSGCTNGAKGETTASTPETDPVVATASTATSTTTAATAPDPSATSTTTTVPAAPATTTTTVPADGRLVPGMQGEAVRALQQRLVALHYDPGPADGRYGGGLTSAVMAFQKVTGMPRNGRATLDVLAAVAAATDPAPLLPDGGPTRIEVDFKRQVLFFWKDGVLLRILPVSTGNGKKYCEEGICGVAVTPSGSFRIERRIKGKRKSYLGVLYDPLYFYGGFAIHGSPSVPGYPASHGCVRIPMHVSRWMFDTVPNRTPVYLIGGKRPATPLPPDPPPAPPAPAQPPPTEAPPPPEQQPTAPPPEDGPPPQPAPSPPPS